MFTVNIIRHSILDSMHKNVYINIHMYTWIYILCPHVNYLNTKAIQNFQRKKHKLYDSTNNIDIEKQYSEKH